MMELIKGLNWEEKKSLDGKSDELFVSFSALFQQAGRFPHYKRLECISTHKLFFIDDDNDFYMGKIDKIINLIKEKIIHCRIKRIVFWGYSSGAYAALICGLTFGENTTVFAISPHLRLNAERTRASEMIPGYNGKYADIRSDLKTNVRGSIHLLMPCFSLRDWPHVIDSQDICNSKVKISYLASDHGIEAELVKNKQIVYIMENIFAKEDIDFNGLENASDLDIMLCRLGWQIFDSLEKGISKSFVWPDDHSSRNNWWFDIKGRYQAQLENFHEAISAVNKAISINPDVSQHYVSLGHYLERVGSIKLSAMSYLLAFINNNRDKWLIDHLQKLAKNIDDIYLKRIITNIMEGEEQR